jgi:hypothetical protein
MQSNCLQATRNVATVLVPVIVSPLFETGCGGSLKIFVKLNYLLSPCQQAPVIARTACRYGQIPDAA